MIYWLINISLLVFSVMDFWYAYTELAGHWQLIFVFIAGIMFGTFLMNLKLIVKNKKLGTYQRQLEKESISSDENAARVKVLESKIEVLEKALENALKNQ